MIAETSIAAYRDLLESGAVNKAQERVASWVAANQNRLPGRMVCRADLELALNDHNQTLGPRMDELREYGVLRVAGVKTTPKDTGTTVQGWRTVEPPPRAIDVFRAKARLREARRGQLSKGESLKQFITEAKKVRDLLPRGSRARRLLKFAIRRAVLRRKKPAKKKKTAKARATCSANGNGRPR